MEKVRKIFSTSSSSRTQTAVSMILVMSGAVLDVAEECMRRTGRTTSRGQVLRTFTRPDSCSFMLRSTRATPSWVSHAVARLP